MDLTYAEGRSSTWERLTQLQIFSGHLSFNVMSGPQRHGSERYVALVIMISSLGHWMREKMASFLAPKIVVTAQPDTIMSVDRISSHPTFSPSRRWAPIRLKTRQREAKGARRLGKRRRRRKEEEREEEMGV